MKSYSSCSFVTVDVFLYELLPFMFLLNFNLFRPLVGLFCFSNTPSALILLKDAIEA